MFNEERLVKDDLINSTSAKSGNNKVRNSAYAAQIFIFLGGLALLIYLIYSLGAESVAQTISSIGWGFLLIVLINFSRHVLRALCIYLAIDSKHRTISFRSVLAARLAGETVSILTFTGPFLGDATKVALMKNRLTLAHSASAVIIDDILYYLSVGFVILTGIGLLILKFGIGTGSLKYALILVFGAIALMLLGLFLLVKYNIKPLSFVLKRLDNRGLLPAFLSRQRRHVLEIETNVFDVYFKRPGTFYSLLGIGLVTHAISVTEVYTGLHLLGVSPTFVNSYIIESLTKVINFAFSFVPGTVGVYEGGNAMILNTLGYTATVGIALALIRRGAILFWAVWGAFILLYRTAVRNRTEQPLSSQV